MTKEEARAAIRDVQATVAKEEDGYRARKTQPFIKAVHDFRRFTVRANVRHDVIEWLNDNSVEPDDVTGMVMTDQGSITVFCVKWIPISST